jgi:hypothetical protein
MHADAADSRRRPRIECVAGPEAGADAHVAFTFATLLTDRAQYAALRQSLDAGGFTPADCEFLVVDNSAGNAACAYRGLDAMLSAARGTYVVLCHQDIRLLADGRTRLAERLRELDAMDPDWALAGNAGGVAPGVLALRITDPHGADQHTGDLPARVVSLDENFIVVKRAARIGFSRDLSGFHLYGADLCLNAATAGYSAYVIDFHLAHLSPGRKDASFEAMERTFVDKWERALAPRWLQTTCTLVRLSGAATGQLVGRVAARAYARIARRMSGAQGWRPRSQSGDTGNTP